jgi:uncharacterized membrane protein YhhN
LGIGGWLVGAVMAILALSGLFLAASAHGDRTFYVMGLGLFLFGCAVIFFLIKKSFDEQS